ncbi:MAG: dethiobiotin synthase [Cyclobacteriaceae bacterium]|nr:dethiobiotin synthase [Cyclobacteriaceae bacterium]
MNYFITGIDTDSGKTLVAAILCEALLADYWKPIQAGLPKDSDTVKSLIQNSRSYIHSEKFLLRTPASPHAAAKIDGVTISLADFVLPKTSNTLIIEGAGGCLVPINDQDFIIDLAAHLHTEIILVADLYLGSINHTLLTIEALKKRNLNVKGIIFNGESNPESERIILLHSGFRCLLRIPKEHAINSAIITKYAQIVNTTWNE